MQGSPVVSLSPSSPSFNSYSSASFAEIAARVVEEFRQESNGLDSDMFSWEPEDNNRDDKDHEEDQQDVINNQHDDDEEQEEEEEEEEEDDDDFEFAVVCNEKQECPSVTADDIFFNGQIKPFYPLFDTSLLSNVSDVIKPRSVRAPLGKLMSEERETDVSLSCSSSEADDLDNLQPGTYCVWTPKEASKESPGKCKKSNSTGSSKRWNKFRELLLHRSNSDGKDTFVFLTPPNHNNNNNKKKASNQAAEHHHRNRSSAKEGGGGGGGDNKRSLLPDRQDLVNFFSNVNGFPKR